MTVQAITPLTAGTPEPTPPARRAQRRPWTEKNPGTPALTRKEGNALLLAALADPGSLALASLANPASSALKALTDPAALALGNLADLNVNAASQAGSSSALAGLTGPAMLALAGLMEPVPNQGVSVPAAVNLDPAAAAAAFLEAALAAPGLTAAGAAATALSNASSAAQEAAAAAREAAAASAHAAQAITLAADAVTAAVAAGAVQTAAISAAAVPAAAVPAIAQDQAGLGADATAKYLGAGFMGLPAGPAPAPAGLSAADPIPVVDGIPALSSMAANTYSNPHDRSFGQAGSAHTAPMVPGPNPGEGADLDLKA